MKHEESVDLKRVSKIAKIDTHGKVIQINNGATVGIKMWGKLDYLCNVLGYRIVKSGVVIGDNFINDDGKKHNREVKKRIKADKANNNMAKKSNKKKK